MDFDWGLVAWYLKQYEPDLSFGDSFVDTPAEWVEYWSSVFKGSDDALLVVGAEDAKVKAHVQKCVALVQCKSKPFAIAGECPELAREATSEMEQEATVLGATDPADDDIEVITQKWLHLTCGQAATTASAIERQILLAACEVALWDHASKHPDATAGLNVQATTDGRDADLVLGDASKAKQLRLNVLGRVTFTQGPFSLPFTILRATQLPFTQGPSPVGPIQVWLDPGDVGKSDILCPAWLVRSTSKENTANMVVRTEDVIFDMPRKNKEPPVFQKHIHAKFYFVEATETLAAGTPLLRMLTSEERSFQQGLRSFTKCRPLLNVRTVLLEREVWREKSSGDVPLRKPGPKIGNKRQCDTSHLLG